MLNLFLGHLMGLDDLPVAGVVKLLSENETRLRLARTASLSERVGVESCCIGIGPVTTRLAWRKRA